MLGALTPAEADRLWWRLVRAMAAVADEIECLKLAPAAVRDSLYGAGVLETYQGIAADLASLADNDITPPSSSWADRLAGTPEKGTPQWHDSDAPPSKSKMTWTQLAARISLARASRRLTPPT